MAKNIIKEIIIMLLLCLAIILILGVLLYEYVPSNKIIPEKVSYITPENIKEELNKGEGVEEEKVILKYSIDAADLKNYQRIKTYVPGKTNPFSSFDNSENTGNNSNQNNNSGNTNTNNSNTTGSTNNVSGSNSTSGNTTNNSYFPDRGTK